MRDGGGEWAAKKQTNDVVRRKQMYQFVLLFAVIHFRLSCTHS